MFKFLKEYWLGEQKLRALRLHKKKLADSLDLRDSLELEVIERLFGEPGSKGDHLRFRRDYYANLSDEQKENVKDALLRILRSDGNWPINLFMCAAHVCADIEMDQAVDDIKRLMRDPQYQLDQSRFIKNLQLLELKLPKQLRFIFTEPYSSKTAEEYDHFIEIYSSLPSEAQTSARTTLLQLIRGSDRSFTKRALQVYSRIDQEVASREAKRLKADPRWSDDYPGFLESLIREKQ